jgi:hypothetical protein
MARVYGLLASAPTHLTGKIIGDHIILDIVGVEIHLWSPNSTSG